MNRIALSMQPDQSVHQILRNADTLAVIGASSKAYRTSHHIMQYLLKQDYRTIPVNPNEQYVLGLSCYHSVQDIPADLSVDVMVIFRNKQYTGEMVRQIVNRSERTGHKPAIWTQLDVSSPEAEAIAAKAGLLYVKNRCIMVDHRNMF